MEWKKCVQKMIDYIESNLKEDLILSDISCKVGYSQFYCSKAFSRQVGLCMKDYIRLRRISSAALELRDTQKRILDIAIEFGFNSQEAFTRSFISAFDVTPAAYRRIAMPIPLFLQRNITHNHDKIGDDENMDEKIMKNVKVEFLVKPARKMLVWHKEGAADYHALCEAEGSEKMCGILESFKDSLGGFIAAWLNGGGMSKYVWGVEVAQDYTGPVPEELEIIEAPECNYVKFCHPPYAEEMHEAVTEAVWNVSEIWNPKESGWEWNDGENPTYEDDREDEGYMVLKPIKRI